MTDRDKTVVFWLRRDIRLQDNVGLSQALASGFPVLPIFIFDPGILAALEQKKDRRVDYFHQALEALHAALREKGSGLCHDTRGRKCPVLKLRKSLHV